MKTRKLLAVAVMVAGLVIFSGAAYADTICDLTQAGASCSPDGGDSIFTNSEPQPTGTGNIDPFVRISANTAVEEGYNTSNRPLQFDENNSPQFTHNLLLSEVEIVTMNSTQYYRFNLDFNQSGSAPLLSLDEVQIFRTNDPNQLVNTFDSDGVLEISGFLAYRLDSDDNDNEVVLNYNLGPGSGGGDMFLLVEKSLFDAGSGDYVVFYSAFGGLGSYCNGLYFDNTPLSHGGDPITSSCANNDGFEEWYRNLGETPVPEPATLLLLGTGLLGVGRQVRRRMKKS